MTANPHHAWGRRSAGQDMAELAIGTAHSAAPGEKKPMGRLGLAVAAVGSAHSNIHVVRNTAPHQNTHRGFGLMQGGLAHLPATARPKPAPGRLTVVRAMAQSGHFDSSVGSCELAEAQSVVRPVGETQSVSDQDAEARPEISPLAPYRNGTEAMLRRYLKLSMEVGRAPSIFGEEFFHAYVSSCRIHTFEDRVIYVLDIERCLESLSISERAVIARLAIQAYSQVEASKLLGWSRTTTLRRYETAIDRLSALLLERKLMDLLPGCQGEEVFAACKSLILNDRKNPKSGQFV